MPMADREIYEFEDFRLDVRERIFERKGRRIDLTDRAFDVLCVLVRNAGRLVTKDQILADVWPDAFVEENSINKNVSLLRRQLGSGHKGTNFIETVRGRGFRFVAPVNPMKDPPPNQIYKDLSPTRLFTEAPEHTHPVTAQRVGNVVALRDWRSMSDKSSSETRPISPEVDVETRVFTRGNSTLWIAAALTTALVVAIAVLVNYNRAPTASEIRTVAVLPFKPVAAEAGDSALEIGIADTLIAKLSGSRKLIVRPLSAVRKYSSVESDELAAGRELEVDVVLNGSIQRSGDKVRVNVRLVRVTDGRPLWSGTFDENLTDIFVVQDAISRKVISALEVGLNVDEQAQIAKHFTTSPEAYEFYLRGREQAFKITPDALMRSIDFYEKAIAVDPNYSLAYSGLSEAYRIQLIPALKSPQEVGPKAVANAAKALELDESLPEAHISRGWLYLFYEWEWEKAEAEARRSIELAPHNSEGHRLYAHVLSIIGRHDEAVEEGRIARELAPLTLITAALEGQFLSNAGRLDEARYRLERALDIDPSFWVTWTVLGRVYTYEGRYNEAIDALTRIRESPVGSPEPIGQLGYALAKAGRREEALKILDELKSASTNRYIPVYCFALVYCGLGDRENTLTMLERSMEAREAPLIFVGTDKRFDWLRDDVRFQTIIRQMSLDGTSK